MPLINNISDSEYAEMKGINFSALKNFVTSPLHFKHFMDVKQEDTSAFKVGRAVHCACLQPSLYDKNFTVLLDVDRRTNAGKAAWAEFQQDNQGKTILNAKEFEIVANCQRALWNNSYFKNVSSADDNVIFEAGGNAELFGSHIKGRIDLYNIDKNIVFDIKTINEPPTISAIRKAIFSKKYYLQAYFYSHIVRENYGRLPTFIFGFVEKKNPNSVGLASVSGEVLNRAEDDLKTILCRYENCKHTDIWPGLNNEEIPTIINSFEYSVDSSSEEDDSD